MYAEELESGRLDGKPGGLSPKTLVQHHRVLREAVQHAVQWQLLPSNPADSVKPPRTDRFDIPALDAEHINKIIAAAQPTRHGMLVHMAILTGLRRGELLGLRWQDVDLSNGSLSVRHSAQRLPGKGIVLRPTKTKRSERAIALSPVTVAALRDHHRQQLEARLAAGTDYQNNDLVFPTEIGTLPDPDDITRAWTKIAAKAAIGASPFA